MSQKSSLLQPAKSASQVLTSSTVYKAIKTNSRRRDEKSLTRMKPASKPEAHEKYQRLIDAAKAAGPVLTAVAHPCDEVSLKGAVEAARLHLIEPILVGPAERIRRVAAQHKIDVSGLRIVESWTRSTAMIPRPKR